MPLVTQNSLENELSRVEALRDHENERRRQRERVVSEAVEAVRVARGEVDQSVKRLIEANDALRGALRHLPERNVFRSFVMGHTRLVGMIQQGIKRTASMDRRLEVHKRQEAEDRQEEEKTRRILERMAAERKLQKMVQPADSDFDTVFGEVIDA